MRRRGPDFDAQWREVAERRQGQLTTSKRGPSVLVSGQPSPITLDTFLVSNGQSALRYTRAFMLLADHDGFRFRVYRKSIFSPLGKLFGMQDIHTGHVLLDRRFIVKGDTESRVVSLLLGGGIAGTLERLATGRLELRALRGRAARPYPPRTAELRYMAACAFDTTAPLLDAIDLVAATADHLRHMGAVGEAAVTPADRYPRS